jgi:hypothetical protein
MVDLFDAVVTDYQNNGRRSSAPWQRFRIA